MIDVKNIESRIVEASKELDRVGFYKFLREGVGSGISARLTKSQFDIASALELMLAGYIGIFEGAEKRIDTLTYDEKSEEFRSRRVFANRYALFIGSEVGLQYLHGGERQKQRDDVETKAFNFVKDKTELIKSISEHLILFLKEATSTDKSESRLLEAADMYLHSLKNAALTGAANYTGLFSEYPDLEHTNVLSVNFKRFSVQDVIEKEKKLTFEDYAGQEEAVTELKRVAQFVKNPHPFKMWGAKAPKGIILAGPPGTGKTYLARVFADECGMPFYAVKISDIVNEYFGKSSQLVNEFLNRPGVIFLDEMESLGRQIGDRNTHEATEQIVNTMKGVMDGFDTKARSYDDPMTFYIGATNNLEIMDTALIRPGRFKPLVMEPYGKDGLAEVYKIQERLIVKSSSGERTIFEPDIDPGVVGEKCAERGLVPADIEYILQDKVNDKAMQQEQKGVDAKIDPISQKELVDAIAKYERSDEAVIKSVIDKVS